MPPFGPPREAALAAHATLQASTAYDPWTIKQGLSLFDGNVALAVATELMANANDCALTTLLKLTPEQRTEAFGDVPVVEVDYQPRADFASNLPVMRIRTRSELKIEDIDKMFHLTGKGGRVHLNHDLGQGAKIAFLLVDGKIIVEVYSVDATEYEEDPEKPVKGFVTLFRLFPDSTDVVGLPKHEHIKLPFFMYLKEDTSMDDFVWLTPSGEGAATEEQRANFNALLLNSMHVHHRPARIGGIDTQKTRGKIEKVLGESLKACSAFRRACVSHE